MTALAERTRAAVPRLGQDVVKRIVDLAVSLTVIAALAALLVLLCALVRLTSRGPALFRQERIGKNMRPFTMLKLRTMKAGNDDEVHRRYVTHLLSSGRPASAQQNGLFKLDCDPRVTRLGRWLRRTSLDELPQLLNVLRGQMSVVGPRPVLPWEAQLFGDTYQWRFAVKPGITGLWQVSGRSRLSMRQALELDVEYAIRQSFRLDLAIMLRTPRAILRGAAR
jgi:lipopolysaccharide/colanic/teichoic acid biosynthesis glycosyltransferase